MYIKRVTFNPNHPAFHRLFANITAITTDEQACGHSIKILASNKKGYKMNLRAVKWCTEALQAHIQKCCIL